MPTVPTNKLERELRKQYLVWLAGLPKAKDTTAYVAKFERDSRALISKLGGQAASLGAYAGFPVPQALELSPRADVAYDAMKQAAIKAGIAAGLQATDVARQILNAGVAQGFNKLNRLARTETVSAYWKNSWDSIADLPDIVMVWGAENGHRTCDYCISRDGLVVEDGNIRDHPNGRCTPIPTLRSLVKYKGTLQPDGSVEMDPRWADQKVKGAKAQASAGPTTPEQRNPLSGKSNPAKPSVAEPVHRSAKPTAPVVTRETISSDLSVHFPNTKLVDWERTATMSIDDLSTASKTLSDLADKYPILRSLGEIRIEPMGKNAVASANTRFAYDTLKRRGATEIMNGSHVTLSSNMSDEALRKGAEASRKAGWWHMAADVDPVQYTVTHEVGHLLDYSTGQKTGRQATKLAKAAGSNQSKYAQRNSREAVAEAFATMETSPGVATKADKAVYDYLRKQVADPVHRAAARPGLVEAQFPTVMSANEANKWGAEKMLDIKTLPSNVQEQIKLYTGGGYKGTNRSLRDGKFTGYNGPVQKDMVKGLDEAMKVSKTTEDVLVNRMMSLDAFPGGDPSAVLGKVLQDKGYLSTAVGGRVSGSGFKSAQVEMQITVPAGTPALWTRPLSQFKSERELLLDRNTQLSIVSAEKNERTGKWLIKAAVLL